MAKKWLVIGLRGTDGKSAYDYAKDGGYTGTEEEFTKKLASEDSGQNPTEGTGWTTEQIDLLDNLFDYIPWTSADAGAIADSLIASLRSGSSDGDTGGSGEDTHIHSYISAVTTAATCTTTGIKTYTCACGHSYAEEIPAAGHNYVDGVCSVCGAADPTYNPDVTLTSISATYSGGDVAVGTAVTALSGVVVTAHYSDDSSETVTGYTLTGTIAEGSNTVTVSYGGKTTTFAVTGVAESGGEEDSEIPSVEIPADATRLAYIESTGTQYIDTGYKPAAKDNIRMTFESTGDGDARWYGASDDTVHWIVGYNASYMFVRYSTAAAGTSTKKNKIFGDTGNSLKLVTKCRFDEGSGYHWFHADFYDATGETALGEQALNIGKADEVTEEDIYRGINANMSLFGANYNGYVGDRASMKLYECIFYDTNGAVKHHYVPVKDASGVVCLYDAVDKQYLYNAGTGDFVGGEIA